MSRIVFLALAAALILAPAAVHAQAGGGGRAASPSDAVLKQVRLDQKLNAQVPFDVTFRDETGKTVRFGDYFGRKPILLNLIQYRCRMLCSEEMKVFSGSLKELGFTIGDQFEVVTLSIDHREQPDLAAAYKAGYVKDYGRPGAEKGWHFLTGDEASIRRVADAIGYHFVYDPRTDQFAHPDGIQILTPQGRIARYFFRLSYPARDIRYGIIEAANGKIGTPIDAIALLCYHYNPVTGKYGLTILGLVRVFGVATVLGIVVGIGIMVGWERMARRRGGEQEPPDHESGA